MSTPESGFDDLDHLPDLARMNYLAEHEWLVENLPNGARTLQIGSYDGQRILRLLTDRPDLQFTGLEIEGASVNHARTRLAATRFTPTFIHGDITNPPNNLGYFDYVLCLNNTLAYILDQEQALSNMRRLGGIVVVSVFGEKFDPVAAEYKARTGGTMKGYTRNEAEAWGGEVIEMPMGYLVRIPLGFEALKRLSEL